MNDHIKAMLKILGFENVSKLPKMKEVMKSYYKKALKAHPDKPGGSQEKFQTLWEALEIVKEYIKANVTVDNDDPGENLAKELFEAMFSKFNTTKDNTKCTFKVS